MPRLHAPLAITSIAVMVALASVSGSSALEPLRPGNVLPAVEGEYLTGKAAILPSAAAGKTPLLLLGVAVSSLNDKEAFLMVLDRNGVVRWLQHGPFDGARAQELRAVWADVHR